VKFSSRSPRISDMSDGKREMIFDILRMLQCDSRRFCVAFHDAPSEENAKNVAAAATVGGSTAGPRPASLRRDWAFLNEAHTELIMQNQKENLLHVGLMME